MGRPTKLTPDLQARIVAFLSAGAYIETAASAAGVSKQTLYTWLRRGAEGDEPFEAFLDAVEKAQGEADIRDLKTIRDAAGKGIWQAAAWRLERRHPEQWGYRKVQPESQDGVQGGIAAEYAFHTVEEAQAAIDALDAEFERIMDGTADAFSGAPATGGGA